MVGVEISYRSPGRHRLDGEGHGLGNLESGLKRVGARIEAAGVGLVAQG